jgi:DNA repair protein RadA/Sms
LLHLKQKTQNIFKQIEAIEPEIVIIDSIQTLHTDYRITPEAYHKFETTAELIKFAKETNIPVILIGHITKMETLLVLKFWNTWSTPFYNLKAIEITFTDFTLSKNRFGSTAEIGL